MSTTMAWFVTIVSLINILACGWLIWWAMKGRPNEVAEGEVTGHTWDDGHLAEYNNPLPRWWLWMFYITIVFALIYLLLYPGLGNFKGILGWTEVGEYEAEMAQADERYGPIFAAYAARDLTDLAKDEQALKVGQRLFVTYCAQCHGSDAKGASGFPNLADNDWLYGGEPEVIKTSILNGRNGIMPPMAAALGTEDDVDNVVAHILSLNGTLSESAGEAGKEKFQMICGACHMPTGQGNPALGAPNLTDKIWLYGGSRGAIKKAITEGRQGMMPAHKVFLGEDKVHLLAAYVYSLGQK